MEPYVSQYGTPAQLNGNGYLDELPVPKFGANPWQQNAQQDSVYAQASLAKGAQSISAQQAQLAKMSYPTFPNSMGLGSQSAFGTGQGGEASPQINVGNASSSSAPIVDSGSHGFNPWSMHGEANAR